MYTDDDLENAITQGVLTKEAVQNFRSHMASQSATQAVDEENFKLVASFNDIFVVIACVLLLFSTSWVTHNVHPALAMASVAILSWGLAEFFVLKRKMAFPAIVLLMTFIGGVFALVQAVFEGPSDISLMLSGAVSSLAAWLHWQRFKVPITVAAGAATAVVFAIALVTYLVPALDTSIAYLMFAAGIGVFYIAMRWDASDLSRVSGKSDVAFWLHLIAAPLIVHPIFTNLGILDGNDSFLSVLTVVSLYVLLSIISIGIDRRAFMVSSLAYVLYALTELFKIYGFAGDSFAYVGVIIGFSLLLLSGFWHKTRSLLYTIMPSYIQKNVPAIK
ncbi:MAG: hypothetical protein KBT50_03255 [Cycloclasticus sp.]|nr:hypothetical protein [Cycloclasticus sp.]MBQ0789611.1 hypothetical protein [Cycloclasticus sp.]